MKAYNLISAAPIFSINLGATFLNGITHDADYLYITDFSAKKIYRFDLVTIAFTVFVTGLAKSPNGIIYDQPNNRCVFVNWGTAAPIMAFDITTAAVSTITTTTLGNCDGIAKDGAGNYYVSSWTLNGISRFNNTFTGGLSFSGDTLEVNSAEPARIVISAREGTLAAGGNIKIGPGVVSHHGITLQVGGKPAPSGGDPKFLSVSGGSSVEEVAAALHAAGAEPAEMATIFEALRSTGALHADVVVR